MNTRHLMAFAEVATCPALARVCVTLAARGEALARVFGPGGLSYGRDLRRRVGRGRAVPGPLNQAGH
ncbi:hypothetical protein DBP15_21325 [Streptomyces sp. CS065A]|nr:hypothetical protein DBP15_21325 [Streptomyces sp. CS065A]